MHVLTSRTLIRPTDLAASHHFYRDVLGLAVAREFGSGEFHGLVFFAGRLAVAAVHETAHGLTMTSFGRRVVPIHAEQPRSA